MIPLKGYLTSAHHGSLDTGRSKIGCTKIIEMTNPNMCRLFEQLDRLRVLKAKMDELRRNSEICSASTEPSTAIIVEPRKHRALGFVVKNALENLPANWNIRIYHGTKNRDFVEKLLETELCSSDSRITLQDLGVDNLNSAAYQKLLTNRKFTEEIPTETFIVFQTDSMINPLQRNLLGQFLEYDYVGAPWMNGQVGNGGFSLRKRSKMLEVITASPPLETGHEDVFLSMSPKVRLHKPDFVKATQFSIETVPSPIFFGVHRVWGYNSEFLVDLCMRCPGLNDLISLQDVVDDGDTCTAIIVEPRKHRALPFVVQNVLENLPANWNVRIYHGTKNREFVEKLLETELRHDASRITLQDLGVENLETQVAYSGILSSREFTEKIPTETFIVFQTDSMINPNHKDLLEKFLQYDYVGAPWPWDHLKVGNGGFSLRKRSKMLHIINTTERYRGAYEDQYFSVGSKLARPYKPTHTEAMEFSIEQVYSPKSFAIHNAWKYLPDHVEQMCKDCPGLDVLMSLQSCESL